MKRIVNVTLIVVGLATTGISSARAGGWSWNPIENIKTVSAPIGRTMSSTTSAVKQSSVKTWKAISSTTASAWNKTTDMLDPFPDDKPAAPSKKTKAKSSWWGSDKADSDKPETANEWLRQERPSF